ncbi:MAG: hypothetical protein K5871_05895 [Lachnospiraceae bacterium]|nr:hypothetical protein [Lachnospiraceae bacterium]
MMKRIKNIDDVDLMDDVFMNLVASDPDVGEDFCRILLSVLLQRKIGKVSVHAQRYIHGSGIGMRGVRLDVEVMESDPGDDTRAVNVYDIEPHTQNEGHFERSLRFRQAKIDSRYMKTGDKDFSLLPDLYVIFISDFDVFGNDYMLYTIHNKCEEIPDLDYGDGLTFLYFYTKGQKGGSDSIRNMLKYLQNSRNNSAVDDATKEVDRYVTNVRRDPEIRGNYMTLGDRIDWEKKLSREEGFELHLISGICKKIKRGKSVSEIAEDLDEDEATVSTIYEMALKFAPDYDPEEIQMALHPEED